VREAERVLFGYKEAREGGEDKGTVYTSYLQFLIFV
jgi:hypothetical protein